MADNKTTLRNRVPQFSEIPKLRIAIGGVGVLVMLYGAVRLVQKTATAEKVGLVKWLAGSVILHDGIIAPIVVAIGWALAKYVPSRGRAYIQGGLAVAGIVALFTLPMIYRRGKSQPGTTLLTRNYGESLLIVLALVAVGTVIAYAMRVRRDSRRSSTAKARPPTDHSSTE